MSTLQDRLVAARYRPSGFDYMRIVLATGVIWLHAYEVAENMPAAIAVWESWARPIVGIILPMFFALSGFLVAGSLERNKSMVSFLGLRVIRLVPALAVEITLSALILGPIFTDLPLRQYYSSAGFWAYFGNIVGDIHFLLPGVFMSNPYPQVVNSQLWTIPFELRCYAMLTVIAGIGLFGARRLLLAAMLLLQAAVAVRLVIHHTHYDPIVRGTLLIGSFLAGLTIYRWRDRLAWNRWLAIGSGFVTAALLLVPPYGDFFISFPAAYLTVYLGLLDPPRSSFLVKGDYSYGMYLYGYPIQQAFATLGSWTYHWWINMLLSWPVALGLAMVSWWWVEKPALRLKTPLLWLEAAMLRFRPFYRYSRLVFLTHREAKSIQTSPARSAAST